MPEEPITPTDTKKRVRKPRKPADNRIVQAQIVERKTVPPEIQTEFLAWYDSKTEKERTLVVELLDLLGDYARMGIGYRIFFATYRAWKSSGAIGKAIKARF